MKKLFTITFIVLAFIVNAQDSIQVVNQTIKYESKLNLVQESVSRLNNAIEQEVASEFIKTDTVLYLPELQAFKEGLKTILKQYENSLSTFDTLIVFPSDLTAQQTGKESRLAQLENKYSIENLIYLEEYRKLREEVAELKEKLNNSIPIAKYAAWVQPTGAHDAYKKGDKVIYNGKLWETTIDANVWAPGVAGWKEVTQ